MHHLRTIPKYFALPPFHITLYIFLSLLFFVDYICCPVILSESDNNADISAHILSDHSPASHTTPSTGFGAAGIATTLGLALLLGFGLVMCLLRLMLYRLGYGNWASVFHITVELMRWLIRGNVRTTNTIRGSDDANQRPTDVGLSESASDQFYSAMDQSDLHHSVDC